MSRIVTSLNATSATGPGEEVAPDQPMLTANAAMQVSVTGAPSSFQVNLEITIDDINWISVLQQTQTGIESPSLAAGYPLINTAFAKARANLVSITGGTSPTVTATIVAAG
jgi:hypothetical protein